MFRWVLSWERWRARRVGDCSASGSRACACGGVRGAAEPLWKTEVVMSGQLALQVGVQESVAPAVVWETLPIDRQVQVTLRLARLLALMVEASRDE
ncbi:MAG: hypothetical protein DLM64_06835 [Solirubrobacterales bacterium]|nr:MAG: hypothetical protein DLM63_00025 [Solirubrobacterales bacterium]PZS11301.1 MAG: hypothetical protein DLM64_06835 [Solirubrobacterales bacterium]